MLDVRIVVVGVDGSANAAAALRWAAALARGVDAELVAVHGVGLLEAAERDEVARRFETEWCHGLEGQRARRLLRDGPPAIALFAAANEVGADLIVVGRRGGSGVTSLLLGSTSAQLAHEATVPVVIVPGDS